MISMDPRAVRLGARPANKTEAIRLVGQVLVDATTVTLMMTLSAYTGKQVTSDFLRNKSKWQFGPSYDELSMDMELPIQDVPIPGQFKLV